jgi:hypothetical protein
MGGLHKIIFTYAMLWKLPFTITNIIEILMFDMHVALYWLVQYNNQAIYPIQFNNKDKMKI